MLVTAIALAIGGGIRTYPDLLKQSSSDWLDLGVKHGVSDRTAPWSSVATTTLAQEGGLPVGTPGHPVRWA